jgi:hypothetical protein
MRRCPFEECSNVLPDPVWRLFRQGRHRWDDWRWLQRERHLARYTFVHINKTGGSSIEKALGLPFRHLPAGELRRLIGAARWERRFTFAFVRNPWDKVVSHYSWRHTRDETGVRSQQVPFRDWVRLTYGEQDPAYYNTPLMFMPQIDWVADETGTLLVKFIGRFESLEKDFLTVCKQIGVSAVLPHLKQSDRTSYHDYYDPETRDIVGRWFARDIERFGYRFEETSR